jgi:glycosyltransferase involved in cell wall biosynthesis
MRISVVIPSFNQARYLGETLASVQSQESGDVEILVFDGGSTDGSAGILKQHESRNLKWVSRPDRGQADAINQGLREATGDILAYLNSDDLYYPGALRAVEAAFAANPDWEILYGDANHHWEDTGKIEPYDTEDWDYDRLLDVCYLCQPAVFWRRSILERHGFLDGGLYGAMDYDYWLRIGRTTPFHRLKGAFLAGSRMHRTNKTLAERPRLHEEILRVALRHARRPPYRWLKVLAQIRAEAGAAADPQDRNSFRCAFVSQVLELARQYRIPLDDAFLSELEKALPAPERISP